MNYTQPQIDRANAVSLEDFLRTQGETLIKSGREYRWKEHDSLTVRGNKWFRHSQSKGGYPIDFIMEFYGKSFPEAVQLLTGESGEGQTEATTAPPTAFHLPLHLSLIHIYAEDTAEKHGVHIFSTFNQRVSNYQTRLYIYGCLLYTSRRRNAHTRSKAIQTDSGTSGHFVQRCFFLEGRDLAGR